MTHIFQLQKPDRRNTGSWFDQPFKTPQDFRSWYSIDYAEKPGSARSKSLIWEQNLKAPKRGSTDIFDRLPNHREDYTTSYGASYNFPSRIAPKGSKPSDFRFKSMEYKPQEIKKFDNVTRFGSANSYNTKLQGESLIPRTMPTTSYQDNFGVPRKPDILALHRITPYNNSYTRSMGNIPPTNLRLRGDPIHGTPKDDHEMPPHKDPSN